MFSGVCAPLPATENLPENPNQKRRDFGDHINADFRFLDFVFGKRVVLEAPLFTRAQRASAGVLLSSNECGLTWL
jgi:hypothetical protein